ncbi:hypothetical protein ACB092_09G091900 [Castanea dentata]
MTLYATLPPLSLFLSFYCSRNFEACELNLFLSTQLSKSLREVSKFASVALVVDIDFDEIQVYVKYFDITFIPSTVFFFNAHHMKMDSGTADHTKWVGVFHRKQDFIDVVEVSNL